MDGVRAVASSLVSGAAVAAGVFLALALPAASAADWPGWRGPARDGVAAGAGEIAPWPADGPKRLWSARVGTGYAAVAVAGGRIVTMGNAGGEERVFALDAATGREIWRHGWPCELKPLRGDLGGPAATPALDGDRVYAVGHEGRLVCLDAATGKPDWSVDLRTDLGAEPSRYGYPASPLVEGRLLVLNLGSAGLALDKRTGKPVWRSDPAPGGYASPVPFAAGDRRCLALFTPAGLVAVDAADGRLLWRHPWQTQYDLNVADPVVSGTRILISSGYDTGAALLEAASGKPEVVWQNKELRSHFSSSVLRDGHVYGFDGNTHAPPDCSLKCVDFATGATRWRHAGLRLGGLVAVGGRLLVLGETGELAVVEASPESFRELARAHVIGGRCWTPPALCDGRAYVRNAEGEVVCVALPGAP
jgi:outer membrane protein assembly factor BamB